MFLRGIAAPLLALASLFVFRTLSDGLRLSTPSSGCTTPANALGLVPTLGGGVAAWQLEREHDEMLDLWRPWDGRNPDRYSLASFAMLPWSNPHQWRWL